MRMTIYDKKPSEVVVPKGFNGVKISLDGRISSALEWKESIESARKYVEQGLQLFWELDLGLFSDLVSPLSHSTQFQSLCLSLKHFTDAVWPHFEQHSVGLCLYRGSADFSSAFPLEKEQKKALREKLDSIPAGSEDEADLTRLFYRNVAADYLALLMRALPFTVKTFVLIDVTACGAAHLVTDLLSKEGFSDITLCVKGADLWQQEWSFGDEGGTEGVLVRELNGKAVSPCSRAFCLPSGNKQRLAQLTHALKMRNLSCRLIPEIHLTDEWHGLDDLFIEPKALSPEGMRKIKGFCAAGGRVISLSDTLGLTSEISFFNWLEAN